MMKKVSVTVKTFDIQKFRDKTIRQKYNLELENRFAASSLDDSVETSSNCLWKLLSECLKDAALDIRNGYKKRKKKVLSFLDTRNKRRKSGLLKKLGS